KHIPPEMVEEVSHEAFIQIYQSLPTFRAESPFKHWISKISVRCCYDYWRERYKSKEIPVADLAEGHEEWAEAVLSAQSRERFDREEMLRETREVLRQALARLSAGERMVITLLYFEELSVNEAAVLLGWSRVNVKVRAYRARKKLHKILSALLKEE
ncbi:MAG TPA: RNA polymerase sigma factor, partial [Dissulfurispiraceae bacterium]